MLLLLIRPVGYCTDDSDPTPTITGTTGGTFSSTAGLVMTNGVIDLDASTAGTYTIKYVTPGNCPDSSTQDITITPSPLVDLGNDVAICQGDSTLLDAGSGHTNYLWNTGETTQTIYADTAGTYSVTVGNGTPITNNNSLGFDGNDDYVSFGDVLDVGNNSFSINFWVKPTSLNLQTQQNLISKTWLGGYKIDIPVSNNEQIRFLLKSPNSSNEYGLFTSSVNENEWLYLTAQLNKQTGFSELFVNGFKVDSLNVSTLDNLDNIGELHFSSHFWQNTGQIAEYFYGLIDKVNFWNKALTQSEIQQYMFTPPTGNESGLVGYWNFNEGSGTTLTDLSGNGNNGTISELHGAQMHQRNILIIVQLQMIL